MEALKMENKKSLLSIAGHIFDTTGLIQNVNAVIDGEVKYSGCGVVVYRPNHIHGDAVIFLKYKCEEFIFGEWVKTYTVSQWKSSDYHGVEMVPTEHKKSLGSKAVKYLSEELAI